MRFKSAVLQKINKPLVVQDFNISKLKRGQVLVKILYSGICRSQIMEIKGKRGEDKWLPHGLGHEGSGVVMKVGSGVRKVKIGNEVILSWIKGKGIESGGFKLKNLEKKSINFGPITTFSNYSIVSENRVFLKPKNLSFKESVLYGCAIPTGSGIVFNETELKGKEKILIIGIGGIGLSCLLALLSKRMKNIYILEKNKKKLDIINNLKFPYIKIYNKNKDINFDYCFECSGKAEMIEYGIKKIKRKGKIIFASHPESKKKIKIDPHELISGKSISGTWGGSSNLDKDIKKFNKLFKDKKISLKVFFSRVYKLDKINDAFKDLDKGNILRALVKMEH
jgi:Zn-dependent alcohol dehydrogenase